MPWKEIQVASQGYAIQFPDEKNCEPTPAEPAFLAFCSAADASYSAESYDFEELTDETLNQAAGLEKAISMAKFFSDDISVTKIGDGDKNGQEIVYIKIRGVFINRSLPERVLLGGERNLKVERSFVKNGRIYFLTAAYELDVPERAQSVVDANKMNRDRFFNSFRPIPIAKAIVSKENE
jgi:hypothetical protein